MRVVLYQPQIPQNAGNIVRTCAVCGFGLVMLGPLGFHTDDRYLKRAGLDYWEGVHVEFGDNLEEYVHRGGNTYFFSSKATKLYTEIQYREDDLFVFGSETKGLPEKFFKKWPNDYYRIPMLPNKRCLNLANAVSIVVYEAWRQQGFRGADFSKNR